MTVTIRHTCKYTGRAVWQLASPQTRHCTCQVSNCLLFRLLLSSSPLHLWPTPPTHSVTLSHSSLNVHGVMMKKYCPHVSESVKFDVIVCVFAAVKHGTAEYCGLSWPCPVSTVWSWSIQRSQLAPAELYNEQLHSDTPESEHWALWSSWMCTICTASVYKFCSSTTTTQTLDRRKRHPSTYKAVRKESLVQKYFIL